MAQSNPIGTIGQLISYVGNTYIPCNDELVMAEDTVYGIGNSYVPDHTYTCTIPLTLRKTCPYNDAKVDAHILWLESNGPFGYSGYLIDKADLNLYWFHVDVYRPSHNSRRVAFQAASLEQIMEKALEHNPFLNNVINLARNDRIKLLDYQIYSGLSDRFYYAEVPFPDKVVMFGTGLNSNTLLNVGLMGKAMNKDFFVSYAECSPEVYEQLKARTPSLYERAQQMEKNKPLFSFMHVFIDKRRNHSRLVELLLGFRQDPTSTRTMVFLGASAYGTKMIRYQGPAFHWVEDFILEFQRSFQ